MLFVNLPIQFNDKINENIISI